MRARVGEPEAARLQREPGPRKKGFSNEKKKMAAESARFAELSSTGVERRGRVVANFLGNFSFVFGCIDTDIFSFSFLFLFRRDVLRDALRKAPIFASNFFRAHRTSDLTKNSKTSGLLSATN